MITVVYLGVIIYFILGAFVTSFISRKSTRSDKKQAFIKYAYYLLIVNIIILGCILDQWIFRGIAAIIILVGLYELFRLFFLQKERRHINFLITSLLLYGIISIGFILFSFLDKELILYTYVLVMVSDASSQHSGQLFGRHKLFYKISPNKTLEGLIGGMLMTLFTSALIHNLIDVSILTSVLLALTISIMANLGDLSASYYKRRLGAKDFSKLIPGHGGFLDRFDSFMVAGAFFYIFIRFIYPV